MRKLVTQIQLALLPVFCHSAVRSIIATIRMKRFLKTLSLLVISLFLVVSGVNAALDRLAHSSGQSSCTWYNEKGEVVLAYTGDLANFKSYGKPNPLVVPHFLHRT